MRRLFALALAFLALAGPALAADPPTVHTAGGYVQAAPVAIYDANTYLTASSGNVANASAAATLAGAASLTTYITGFQCTPGGATAAALVIVTVAGVITGTMSYIAGAPAGVAVMGQPLIVQFPTPVPASAVNTAIVVTMPALGGGNTNAACSAQGFRF